MILACTGCGKSLKIADEHAGRRARCPSCSTVVEVPAAETSEVRKPAMQPVSVHARSENLTPLPMSPPNQTFEPAPRHAAPNSTALVPVPHAYNQRPANSAPQSYAAPSHYEPRVQPYNPYPQQQYGQGYQRPQHQADPGIAALLEVLGGMFAQTFGLGHIYAGNITAGLLFMFGYWFLCFINIMLMFVLVGILTYPLCWIMIMIISPIVAANSVKRY